MTKRFYTTSEAASRLQVSSTTVFRAITNKVLKAVTTPGGHYRISEEEVENFLKTHHFSNPAKPATLSRILVVEDNPLELRFFKQALEQSNQFEVHVASSGYEAGFLTKSIRPDLILLDIFLNDVDGRDVARLIRSDPELKHTKLIAITASTDQNVLRELQEMDFDSLVFKPIDAEELQIRIHRLLL